MPTLLEGVRPRRGSCVTVSPGAVHGHAIERVRELLVQHILQEVLRRGEHVRENRLCAAQGCADHVVTKTVTQLWPVCGLKCLDPGSGRKTPAIWHGAGANRGDVLSQKLSTENGATVLMLAWCAEKV